jgi:N-acylglucosamine 2-epimerase
MEKNPMESRAAVYRSALLEDVIPFWMKYSPDREYGGYFTCLNRDGSVFDTDKLLWLQGREVWMFAMLFNQVEAKQEWLDMALLGAGFLLSNGKAEDGSWYFSLTRDGKPLTQPYNIFSDCFATQAFGQLYKATGEDQYAEVALTTFRNILERRNNPKGRWNKSFPGTRPLKNFALPMILSNLAMEIEHLLDASLVNQLADECTHEVMDVFYHHDSGTILENVSPDGEFSDTFEGRLLNPGHAIEAMWFIMDIAVKKNDIALVEKACSLVLHTLEYAWDKEYQGIFYFMDVKGYPPQQLEWDQKLWWVHMETLIALLKGYQNTENPKLWNWFEKVHDYTWNHFPDPQYGEWFGYLNRSGEVLLPLKGGKWKGCYHVPRGLYQCWKTLEKIQG